MLIGTLLSHLAKGMSEAKVEKIKVHIFCALCEEPLISRSTLQDAAHKIIVRVLNNEVFLLLSSWPRLGLFVRNWHRSSRQAQTRTFHQHREQICRCGTWRYA